MRVREGKKKKKKKKKRRRVERGEKKKRQGPRLHFFPSLFPFLFFYSNAMDIRAKQTGTSPLQSFSPREELRARSRAPSPARRTTNRTESVVESTQEKKKKKQRRD